MDWRRVIMETEHTRALSEDERDRRLTALAAQCPETYDHVARLSQPARTDATFMRTSSPAAPAAPAFATGDQLGVWRITAFIGAGGMGEVYRASRADGLYDQTAALKVLRGRLEGESAQAFERERQRLARLDDPGVTRIIDGGTAPDGRPFMVMEHVDGRPIDAVCAAWGLDRDARLRLIARLCEAVGHAHARLVLHRDIKASNVLVTEDGAVKLIDFGIASVLDDEEALAAGPFTLATAAPEQLFGEPASAATDVFGLGALAHQLVTGAPPERQADGAVAIDTTRVTDRDLAAILSKAVALAPADRYSSADAFADELRAFLEHRPVAARGGGRSYRIAKYLRRYRLASGLAAIAVSALIGGLVVSVLYERKARANLARAEYFLERAELTTRVQSAYADALQRLFVDDDQAARIKEILLARAEEAHAQRDADPRRAAEIAYAVGRSFVDRFDYPAGVSVLKPWIEEGYGDPRLVLLGKWELAAAYRNTERNDEALALFREVEAAFETGFDAETVEHAFTVSMIATLTNAPEDLTRGRALLERVIARGVDPEDEKQLWHHVEFLSNRLGDFERAYRAAARTVAIGDAHPLMALYGRNTDVAALAWYELFYRDDYAAAAGLLRPLVADDDGSADDPTLIEAHQFLGAAALFDGDFATAETHLRRSQALAAVYFPQSPANSMWMTELNAARGAFAEAEAALEAFATAVQGRGVDRELHEMALHPRVVLSAAYLAALRDGPEAGRQTLAAHGVDAALIERGIVLSFMMRRLEALGVAPPNGEDDG